MATKTTKSKKQSRVSRVLKKFNPTTPKGKLLSFMLVFALFGGGFYIYKSQALTYAPDSMRHFLTIPNIVASDGYRQTVYCISVTGQTGFGPIANCVQNDASNSYFRNGFYSPITKRFTVNGGWVPHAFDTTPMICRNLSSYSFQGTYAVASAFGTIKYGQIYRNTGGSNWQVKWAIYSAVAGTCSTSGVWMNAKPM